MTTRATESPPNAFNSYGVAPLATLALIAAVAGLLLSFGRRTTRVLTTIAGAAGAVFLLMLKSKIDGGVLMQGQGLMQIEYGAAFLRHC